MKKITKEEFYKIGTDRKNYRGRPQRFTSPIMTAINKIEIGEIYPISIKDWWGYYSKTTLPTSLVLQTFRRSRTDKKFTIRTTNDGWYVLRIK